MPRSTCPFAAALFGSIAGSAAGAAFGAALGWMLHAAYAASGGPDPRGFALLAFGTLGMGVGGSGGAVGGMLQGWSLVEAKGPAEASPPKWGAGLGGLWSLQPILWLALTAEGPTALAHAALVAATLAALGALAALVGALAARSVGRACVVGKFSPLPARRGCR